MNEYPLPNLAYSRTFRFALEHIAKLSDLSQRLRKDQSEVIRDALDEYYERHQDEPNETGAEPAA